MTIQVTSGGNRPTADEQIQTVLDAQQGLKLRIVVQIYDPKDRQYEQLRDTYWQVTMPATAGAEQVKQLLDGIGGAITQQAQS